MEYEIKGLEVLAGINKEDFKEFWRKEKPTIPPA